MSRSHTRRHFPGNRKLRQDRAAARQTAYDALSLGEKVAQHVAFLKSPGAGLGARQTARFAKVSK